VLLKTKAIMSPSICHWMETNVVFYKKMRSTTRTLKERDKVSKVISKSQQWFKRYKLD